MSPSSHPIELLYGEPNELITQTTIADKEIKLHRDVVKPLNQLVTALASANLPIVIVSAWRSFEYQCGIWNNKWLGRRPLLDRQSNRLAPDQMSDDSKFNALCYWSAVPGTSRHHWGTDFDIFLKKPIEDGYQVQLVPEEFDSNGVCAELEQWLQKNLESFGFYRPYRKDCGGVSPEPWHISYFPIADQCVKKARATDVARRIKQSNLQGKTIVIEQLENYFSNFVLNIEPSPDSKN